MPASDWLAPEVIACLEAECGTADEALAEAYEAGVLFGATDASGFNAAGASEFVFRSRSAEQTVWRRVAVYHGCASQDDKSEPARGRFTVKSRYGRRFESVTDDEADQAARIYMRHRDEFRRRTDGGRYATHELYTRDRNPAPEILSRPMVGHLIVAIERGWLEWDSADERLVISDEFRTSPGMFTIPRPETQVLEPI